MYNNPYYTQITLDRINAQMAELEKMKQQLSQPMPQPTNLTQNFQLAPNNREVIKYANNIEEVQKEVIVGDTPFFSKDMSIVWVKNANGNIKTYELSEMTFKDGKDLQIDLLQSQIDELRKEVKQNERNISNASSTKNATDTKRNDEPTRKTVEDDEPTSVSKVSRSKKE